MFEGSLVYSVGLGLGWAARVRCGAGPEMEQPGLFTISHVS